MLNFILREVDQALEKDNDIAGNLQAVGLAHTLVIDMFHDLGDFFVIGVDHMFPNAVKVIDQFAGNRRAEKQKVFRVADIELDQ